MNQETIAVIGAGTMGAGIAQVAAAAGHPVLLHDVREGAAAAAIAQIAKSLDSLVAKGRLSAEERSATVSRLQAAGSLAALSGAALVVEVIVEDLAAKQALLRELEGLVGPETILASNTSSISITAIANGMKRPERMVGMHFFNPVPLMKLVEVVHGAETERAVADRVAELARRWGKTPVHATSTPGFIVNRIARPYYAEALALLQERAATPTVLDALARGAGFRMGPCELMDLIGHDVNYAVTLSVFNANYGDRRYVPSLVQKALVDGGRLGRKVGKGFYESVPPAEATPGDAPPLPAPPIVHGDGPLAQLLSQWMAGRGLALQRQRESDWVGLSVPGIELHLTDGRMAAQLAAQRGQRELAVIDLPLATAQQPALAIAFAATASEPMRALARDTLAACGWRSLDMGDAPGLWTARTVCMLVNEGADAVQQGVCDEEGADLAMKLGTNWPAGPFEWLRTLGVEYVATVLDHLHAATPSERYRVSPLLQQRRWAARWKS